MKKFLVALALVALLPAASVWAGSVTVGSFTGGGVYVNPPVGSLHGGGDTTAGPSALQFSGFTGTNAWINGMTLEGFCVDLQHEVAPGNTYSATLGSMSAWNIYSGRPANAGADAAWLYNTDFSASNTVAQDTGLQLAIWEVLYDTGLNLSSGNFTGHGTGSGGTTATTDGQAYLTALGAQTGPLGDAIWVQLTSGDDHIQDFIVNYNHTSPPPSVPEPGSMLLLGTGLIGLAGAVRRRMKK